ncbi:MAG: hypothetical protein L0Y72_31450 [Gemmataceae bacterium]|nr:hypothetical protein [Gemmataceae bacterium]MCI0743568.1 hypothetical protein [Gemmataceae bacterium]
MNTLWRILKHRTVRWSLVLAGLAGVAAWWWLPVRVSLRRTVALPAMHYDKAISPDGRFLALATQREGNLKSDDWSETVTFWDLQLDERLGAFSHEINRSDILTKQGVRSPIPTLSPPRRFHFPFSYFASRMAFFPSERKLLRITPNKAYIHDIATGESNCHETDIHFGTLQHDATGRILILRPIDGRLEIQDFVSGLTNSLSGFPECFPSGALETRPLDEKQFKNNGLLSEKLAITLRDLSTGKARHEATLTKPLWVRNQLWHLEDVNRWALSNDGNTLVHVQVDVQVLDLAKNRSWNLNVSRPKNPVLSPDGRFLAVHGSWARTHPAYLKRILGWLGITLSEQPKEALHLFDLASGNQIMSWDIGVYAYFTFDGASLLVRDDYNMSVYDNPGRPWGRIGMAAVIAACVPPLLLGLGAARRRWLSSKRKAA